MKTKITGWCSVACLLFILLNGCTKTTTDTPVAVPLGNFSGLLTVIHQSQKTGKLDTTIANVVLTMSSSTGFAVTSDTTVVQAGSKGPFILNSAQLITFEDQTAPANVQTVGTSKKIHLNGVYTYGYDGTNFDFYLVSADTIGYNYILKKN